MEILVVVEILNKEQLKAGDVLLCYSSTFEGKVDEISQGYSHAAIYTKNNGIVESSSSGVKTTTVSSLLDEYEHVAVLRNKELWSENRLQKLDEYTKSQIGKKFNSIGMYKVPKRKVKQNIEATQRIEGYFEGNYKPPAYERNAYFCSELVTSAFIHVGIIDESASILLSPDTFSPEDIGQDKAFGFFVGYVISDDEYTIPENDLFRTII